MHSDSEPVYGDGTGHGARWRRGGVACVVVTLACIGVGTGLALKPGYKAGNFLMKDDAEGYKKSNRPRGYGMTAELNRKKNSKFDVVLANEALTWIAEVLKSGGLDDDADTIHMVKRQQDVVDPLKSGVLLCKLINIIKPGSVKKINELKMASKQMENIGNFLSGAVNLDVSNGDLFQTVDLFEGQNVPRVVNGILALGRKSSMIFEGPALGPRESTENKREFTEEQLREGASIIGLQRGSNKGASQAGMNFGKTRAIID